MIVLIVILIIIAVGMLIWFVSVYNRLIRMRNQVKNSWAQIDVQLQRRHDLIPNLVACVKRYMEHERSTLEAVTEARSSAMKAREELASHGGPTGSDLKALVAAEGALQGALGKIFALAENYPDLKASDNMRSLQEELASTENKVAFSRQAYNDSAMLYNNAQQVFPANLFSGSFGHRTVDLYEVEEQAAKKAVKVEF